MKFFKRKIVSIPLLLIAIISIVGSGFAAYVLFWESQTIPETITIEGMNANLLGASFASYSNETQATQLETITVSATPHENCLAFVLDDTNMNGNMSIVLDATGEWDGITITYTVKYVTYWLDSSSNPQCTPWSASAVVSNVALGTEAIIPNADLGKTVYSTPVVWTETPTEANANGLLIQVFFDSGSADWGDYNIDFKVSAGETTA